MPPTWSRPAGPVPPSPPPPSPSQSSPARCTRQVGGRARRSSPSRTASAAVSRTRPTSSSAGGPTAEVVAEHRREDGLLQQVRGGAGLELLGLDSLDEV